MTGYAARLARCREVIEAMPGAVVAFSGGVDSSMLLHACVAWLGVDRVLAVTARSASLPAVEEASCVRVAREVGARHRFVETHELAREGYRRNSADRCYFCKTELFIVLAGELSASVASEWPVLYGQNMDDKGDHRPGARAAEEHAVVAPLAEAGLTKDDIRRYSREHGLSTAEKPSFACLASRIPYGTEVHAGILEQLERAENVLRAQGFRQFRVRHHDTVARVELPTAELARAVDLREELTAGIRRAGYTYVALDLAGFRSGSMNEVLAAGRARDDRSAPPADGLGLRPADEQS